MELRVSFVSGHKGHGVICGGSFVRSARSVLETSLELRAGWDISGVVGYQLNL